MRALEIGEGLAPSLLGPIEGDEVEVGGFNGFKVDLGVGLPVDRDFKFPLNLHKAENLFEGMVVFEGKVAVLVLMLLSTEVALDLLAHPPRLRGQVVVNFEVIESVVELVVSRSVRKQ